MRYCLFFLIASVPLFAQSSPQSSTSTNNPVPNASELYFINPYQRGQDIVNMFTTLTAPGSAYVNRNIKNYSQIAIQTTRNGLIPNVLGLDYAKNYTILIVQYYDGKKNRYIVVPTEQIIELVYAWNSVNTTGGNYTFSSISGILPFYHVDILQRAQDIIEIYGKLTTNTKYYTYNLTQVQLQTSLSGPFYALPSSAGGLIADVQSISLNSSPYGTLLLVSYETVNNQNPLYYIVVPTEQIYGISSTYNVLNY